MLEILKHEKKTIGIKETSKAMKQGKIRVLYIADDLDNHLKKQIEDVAKDIKLEVVRIESKRKLGVACGIDVSASAVGILK
ncbi:MAG: ribosomal L7Ae/L30e/S12e/Gadd45 family protein [Clostridiales bacterium]|nr:ribosomal L7Ae/L30e/S12e/Gadd45 family protein [Clostridiales bacterium]